MIKNTIFLLSLLALSACQEKEINMIPTDDSAQWNLVTGQDNGQKLEPIPDHQITLQILPNEWVGTAGINHYQVPVQVLEQQKVKVSENHGAMTTRMAGNPKAMEMEYRYLHALGKVEKMEAQDQRLILSGEGVKLIFQPARQAQPLW